MKPSRYNFIHSYQFNKDYSVVYNAYHNTVGILTSREAEFIRTCDRSLGIHYTKMNEFKEKGFILDRNTSELSKLKVDYLKSKFDEKLFSVVIVPTYQCNLNCTYCYEKLSYSVVDETIMSEQAQDKIYDWIKSQLGPVETLEVFWHGGEPLIALDVVERLGGMLQNLAKEKGIRFVSKMSTNGYLFTPEVAEKLHNLGIGDYKMSIDGCRENHDLKKRHKDGSVTYDTILGNIEKSKDFVNEIDLRVNVDKEKLQDAYDIMKILAEKGLNGKVKPRLGRPQKFADEKNDVNFTKEEFMCEAIHYSLRQGIEPDDLSRKDCFCLVNQLNGYIIDGHGTIFKCVAETGDGQRCGKLLDDGTVELNKNFYDYGNYNPTVSEQCEECRYLPICYGECAFDRKEGNPCTYGSIIEECGSQFINAYVVNRVLKSQDTQGNSRFRQAGFINDLIMGKYGEKAQQFLEKAASTYTLGNLIALGEKNGIALSEEDATLLLQLMQPAGFTL